MSRKKRKQVHCIFFIKKKYAKDDILNWCKENKDKYKLNHVPCRDDIIKKDKEYQLMFRNKSRFSRTNKENKDGIKIVTGYLK